MQRPFRLLPRPRDYGATGRLGFATPLGIFSPITNHQSLHAAGEQTLLHRRMHAPVSVDDLGDSEIDGY